MFTGNLIGTSKHSGVLPAIGSSRPLSKPIVRNPLNFHPQLPPPTSPPLAKSRSDSPSQIEQVPPMEYIDTIIIDIITRVRESL